MLIGFAVEKIQQKLRKHFFLDEVVFTMAKMDVK